MTRPATILVAAGLDPSGKAGLVRDVQVAASFGCNAMVVATASTVQNDRGVTRVVPTSPTHLREQLEALGSQGPIGAVKIGMLPSIDQAQVLADFLRTQLPNVPVVWDPVLRPTRGVALFQGNVQKVRDCFISTTHLITPNTQELETLTGTPVQSLRNVEQSAQKLLELGFRAVLAKGGHLLYCPESVQDLLCEVDGITTFDNPRIAKDARGTGCTLSTAIAAQLARHIPLAKACHEGISFVRDYLAREPVMRR